MLICFNLPCHVMYSVLSGGHTAQSQLCRDVSRSHACPGATKPMKANASRLPRGRLRHANVFYTCSCQQTTDAQHEHKKKNKKNHTPFDAQLLQSDGHMAIWPEARCQRDLAPAGHGLPRHALARSGRGANAQGAAVQRQPLLCQRGSRAGPLCIDILADVEAA
jgi:hypothetical protein